MKTSIAIGALALAAIAGSANASVIPLYDFSTTFSSPNDATTSDSGPVTGSNPFSTYQWTRSPASTNPRSSVTGATGSVTMSNVARSGAQTNFAVFTDSNVLPQPVVNLSGTTAIELNVTAYTGAATNWTLYVYDSNASFAESGVIGSSGTGLRSFAVSSLLSFTSGGSPLPSIDWSSVVGVELIAQTTGTNATAQASSFTFNSFNAVVVPEPGAAALLAPAGLLLARRRR
jgi:hypothetical protein